MGPLPDQLRDLGIVLDNSPDLIRLRLRSRAGWPARIAYGLLAVLILGVGGLAALGFSIGKEPSYTAAAAALGIAVGLLSTLYLTVRWSLRQGVLVRLTPDRFEVRKHWSDGGEVFELFPDQVRLEENARAIVVRDGRKEISFGSALTVEERGAVVALLNDALTRHQGANREAAPPLAPGLDSADDGPATSEARDLLALALCGPFRACDPGKVHLAPSIPPPVLAAALQGYLDLQDDEVLLAIVGVDKTGVGAGALGCSLTTRRVYWSGKPDRPVANRPAPCRSLDYAAVPATIGRVGLGGITLDLGEGRRLRLRGDKALANTTERFLMGTRALDRGELPARGIPEADRARAQAAWHRVVVAGSEARALQDQIRVFQVRANVVGRAKVTPVLVAACVAVFVAMVARGVSPFAPAPLAVLAWGADFGPSVVFDHQYWRPVTSMFLHFGIVHLLMNMFCLWTAGPAIERFFGHAGFAALYLLSGLGGAIASLLFHPTVIGAGASGAIFGIFGGLLGYLAIRRREVPPAVFAPMRAGAVAFVGYNTLFSLSIPGIDTAAHLGGLATGFVCGLVLTAIAPSSPGARTGLTLLLRQAGAVVILAAGLAGIGAQGLDGARARILADPKMGPAIRDETEALPALNTFFTQANPVFAEFDRIGTAIDGFLADLKKGGVPRAPLESTLNGMKAECRALGARVAALPAANPEIAAIRGHLAAAQGLQLQMLEALSQVVTTGDDSHVTRPGGFNTSADAYLKEFQTIKTLRDAYFQAHHLEVKPPTP